MKTRQIKKQLKKQAIIELYESLAEYDDSFKIDKKIILHRIQLDDETHHKEYIFYSKLNDRFIALRPHFENKKVYNVYGDDDIF